MHRKGSPGHATTTASVSRPPHTPQALSTLRALCDLAHGGAMDASRFQGPGGTRYVMRKVDGNLGHLTMLLTNNPIDGGLVEAPTMIYWC
ncbi:hypothetical protein V8D89_009444 [Ganoderma adspersum]